MAKPTFIQLLALAIHVAIILLQIAILTSPNPAKFASTAWLDVQPVLLNSSSGVSTTGKQGVLYTITPSISSSTTTNGAAGSVSASSSASASLAPSAPTTSTVVLSRRSVREDTGAANNTLPAGIINTNSTTLPSGTAAGASALTLGVNLSDPATWRSDLRVQFGLLGSCFNSFNSSINTKCTSSSIHPSFDTSALAPFGFNPADLPRKLSVYPSLVLVDLLLVIALLPATLLPLLTRCLAKKSSLFESLTESGPRQRHANTFQSISNAMCVPLAILIFGLAVALRIKASSAASAFNRTNAAQRIPSFAMVDPWDNALPGNITSQPSHHTLQASPGGTYGLCYVTAILLVLLFFLRRLQLRHDKAQAQAKTDLEAHFGRRVFAKAAHILQTPEPLSPGARSPRNDDPKVTKAGGVHFEMATRPTYGTSSSVEPRSPTSSPAWGSPIRPFFPSRVGFNTHPVSDDASIAEKSSQLRHAPSLQSLASRGGGSHSGHVIPYRRSSSGNTAAQNTWVLTERY